MITQWKVQIDWDRDGNFTESDDDVTSYVMRTNWFLGMRKPYEETAQEMMMVMKLRNADRRFTPQNGSSPLAGKVRPQVPVRVVSDDGTTERVMWTGWIQKIKPSVGRYGERIMDFLCSGAIEFYTATETKIELQEDKRTDEIIEQLVSEVVYPPKLAGVARLGIPGNQELGVNTRLGDLRGSYSLEEGQMTLGYAADNWVRQGGFTNQVQDGYDVYRSVRSSHDAAQPAIN